MNVAPTEDCTFWYVNEYYTLAGRAFPVPQAGRPGSPASNGPTASDQWEPEDVRRNKLVDVDVALPAESQWPHPELSCSERLRTPLTSGALRYFPCAHRQADDAQTKLYDESDTCTSYGHCDVAFVGLGYIADIISPKIFVPVNFLFLF
jgi:hypothetical protein